MAAGSQGDAPDMLREWLLSVSEGATPTSEDLGRLAQEFTAQFLSSEGGQVQAFSTAEIEFRDRCYSRWKAGLDMFQVLRHFCAETAELFRNDFSKFELYAHDPLLGVLMRQHANACRVSGEIEALLRSGYPDGALARWRTLHEIAVAALLVREHGVSAAEEYIRFGIVEAVGGMEAYQATAHAMSREPYTEEELETGRAGPRRTTRRPSESQGT